MVRPRRSMRVMISPVSPAATPSGLTITNDRSVIRLGLAPGAPPADRAAGVAGPATGGLGQLAPALPLALAVSPALDGAVLCGGGRLGGAVEQAHAELDLGQAQVEVADVVLRRHAGLAQ